VKFLFDNDVPGDLRYFLLKLGHEVVLLRESMPKTTDDAGVLLYAGERQLILVTCNREDFVFPTEGKPHRGVIALFRRKSRVAKRAALLRLLDSAGETGISGNLTFA
jgi:hypothetical protein